MPPQTNSSIGDLRFPVISITHSGAITVHMNRNTLEVEHVKMIRRGWYRGMLIIDSTGDSRKVRRAKQMKGQGPFWGFSLLYSRRVRVELELQPNQKLELPEVKKLLCDAMERDPHMWNAALYEDGVSGWQRKVRDAKTTRDIIDLLRSNQWSLRHCRVES